MTEPRIRKKIGYLSAAPRVSTRPQAELAGPRTHVLGVIEGFKSLGWQVKTYIVGDRVPLSWIEKGSEQNIRSSYLRILMADFTRLMMGFINSFRAYQEIGGEVDWVYERLAVLQSLGWIFKRFGKKIWILETNAPLTLEAGSDRKTIVLNKLARYLENKSYQDCDYLICVSVTLKEIIMNHFRIPGDKILVVPNGVDTNFFNPEKTKPNRIFDNFTIGFVGSFARWQGLDVLMAAINNLRKQGVSVNAVLVGDGPMRSELEAQIDSYGIRDHIKFSGMVPHQQVPGYIAGFDVGYAGHVETVSQQIYFSPLKIYEYLSMAKPVVASEFEVTRDSIISEAGILFEPGNAQGLENAIRKCLQIRNDLPTIGMKARKEIVRNHSWMARVQDLIDQIQRHPQN